MSGVPMDAGVLSLSTGENQELSEGLGFSPNGERDEL